MCCAHRSLSRLPQKITPFRIALQSLFGFAAHAHFSESTALPHGTRLGRRSTTVVKRTTTTRKPARRRGNIQVARVARRLRQRFLRGSASQAQAGTLDCHQAGRRWPGRAAHTITMKRPRRPPGRSPPVVARLPCRHRVRHRRLPLARRRRLVASVGRLHRRCRRSPRRRCHPRRHRRCHPRRHRRCHPRRHRRCHPRRHRPPLRSLRWVIQEVPRLCPRSIQ